MPDRVRITDVAPRDGLQNEAGFVPTGEKARLVGAIAGAGVQGVEVTSFVSRKWVPQLGDAAELCDLLAQSKPAGVSYSALAPNERGMEELLAANARAGSRLIDKVCVFTAASETFCQRNTNASIAETIERFRPVVAAARGAGLAVRGYVSCMVACPFEGAIDAFAVASVAGRLADLGIEEIDLADTIGAGTPETVGRAISTCLEYLDESHGWADASGLTLHLHDTQGRAAECARVGLELGVRSFDGSVGGLGGCPYAGTSERPAPGNIATGALLDAVERAGLRHEVDRARLEEASRLACGLAAAARGGVP